MKYTERIIRITPPPGAVPRLCLETGDALDAARGLCEASGSTRCGQFGDYEENSSIVFYEKELR
jgi:hypothetical protein